MKTKWIVAAALSALLVAGIALPAEAAKTVSVTLPTFDVTLNGTVIENENRQYPLLVYKDITYVPMTYHDCRFLGLETTWNQQEGLGIHKSDLTGAYYEDTATKQNSKRANAQIASGTIKVNGKQIDNASEPYPLLLYRDVTYFPLTWRFAVNEFGWQYQFDSKSGLLITSDNTRTESVMLNDARNEEYAMFSYAVKGEYLYYEGAQGEIYRRPLDALQDDTKREKLAQLEEDLYWQEGFYPRMNLYAEGANVYCRYHVGGGIMGSDRLLRISPDGTVSDNLLTGKVDSCVDYGDAQVQIPRYVHSNNPEKILVTDKTGTREISEENQVYEFVENGYDYQGHALYVLAADWKEQFSTGDKYLYRLDLANETFTKVFDEPMEKAAYCDGALYLWQNLKRQTIDGVTVAGPESTYKYDLYWLNQETGEKVLIDEVNSNCAVNASGVYYQDTADGNLLYWNKDTQKAVLLHGNYQVSSLFSAEGYVVVCFAETADNPCRLMVFNADGRQVYTSADVIDSASIGINGTMLYRLAGTTQLVKVELQDIR